MEPEPQQMLLQQMYFEAGCVALCFQTWVMSQKVEQFQLAGFKLCTGQGRYMILIYGFSKLISADLSHNIDVWCHDSMSYESRGTFSVDTHTLPVLTMFIHI